MVDSLHEPVTRRAVTGVELIVVGPPIIWMVADSIVAPAGRADRSNFT